MAAYKSIITSVEKNPDGTVKQKAIVTGITQQSKQSLRLLQIVSNKTVTLATTPRKKSYSTLVRPQHPATSKQRSGLTPVRPKLPCEMVRVKGCLQKAGIFPIKPKQVTAVQSGNNQNADGTNEDPKKVETISARNTNLVRRANQEFGAIPKATVIQRTSAASKSVAPKTQPTFATNRRRSSRFASALAASPSVGRKMKSRIPVLVQPTTVPQKNIQSEDPTVYLIKREKELVEQKETIEKELAIIREKLKIYLDAKFEESALRSAGAAALSDHYESPAAAFNLRPPGTSTAKKEEAQKHQIEMDFSPLLAGTPSPLTGNLPPDILLSISKSKTPGSLFENYKRNCAALQSPSTVRRRSRSLSLPRGAFEINETSISQRVMQQLRHLYG